MTIKLLRDGLKIIPADPVIPATGSAYVPVELTSLTPNDEYENWSKTIHVKYILGNKAYEEVCENNLLTSNVFVEGGFIKIWVTMVNGSTKVNTPPATFIVEKAEDASVTIFPTDNETWQSKVKEYVDAYLETHGGSGGSGGSSINDTTVSTTSVWSSQKVSNELAKKVGYQEVVNNKLYSYSDNTKTNLLSVLDLPIGGESVDVQINGTSIVENGVANIPYATKWEYGLIQLGTENYGVYLDQPYKVIRLSDAGLAGIDDRVGKGLNGYGAITPQRLPYALRSGLGKASEAEKNAWTYDEKSNARSLIGIREVTQDQYNNLNVTDDNNDMFFTKENGVIKNIYIGNQKFSKSEEWEEVITYTFESDEPSGTMFIDFPFNCKKIMMISNESNIEGTTYSSGGRIGTIGKANSHLGGGYLVNTIGDALKSNCKHKVFIAETISETITSYTVYSTLQPSYTASSQSFGFQKTDNPNLNLSEISGLALYNCDYKANTNIKIYGIRA